MNTKISLQIYPKRKAETQIKTLESPPGVFMDSIVTLLTL